MGILHRLAQHSSISRIPPMGVLCARSGIRVESRPGERVLAPENTGASGSGVVPAQWRVEPNASVHKSKGSVTMPIPLFRRPLRPSAAFAGPAMVMLLFAACTPATPPTATTAPAAPTAAPAAPKPTEAAKPGAAAATAAPAPAATSAAPAAAKPAAAPSGEITFANPGFQNEQWDPSKGTRFLGGQGGGIGAPIYESLYLHRPPNGELRPFLLESGTMAPDGKSWTFKLKDGIKFSNGDPMTAEDVKFSLDHFRDPGATGSGAPVLRQVIEDVQVVDRLTTKILMKEPLVTLPVYLGGQTGNEGIVLPKKYIDQVGWEAFAKKPIGSGPYKVAEHKVGDTILYEANENYWGSSKPLFQRIRSVVVPDEQTRLAMLRSGQADLVGISTSSLKQVKAEGFSIITMPGGSSWRIQFYGGCCDQPDNPLKKLEVRKALTLALNKQEMLTGLVDGAGTVATYAHSDPSFSIGAPKLAPTPYDPAEAKRLLTQAGYPNGLPMTLWSPEGAGCTPEEIRRFSETTAAAWEAIGVKTTIRPIDYAVMRPKVRDALGAEYVGTASTFCTPGTVLAQRDLANFWRSQGAWRMTDAADAEIAKSLAATTQEEMVKWSEEAYKKLADAYAGIGVLQVGTDYATTKKLADYPPTPGMDNILQWMVSDRSF